MEKPMLKKVGSDSEKKLSEGAIRFACAGGSIGQCK